MIENNKEVELPAIKPFKEPEKVELTTQEKIVKFEEAIAELNGYIDFTNMVGEKEKGDTFVLNDIFCLVKKVTPKDRHMDIEIYELDGTEEDLKAGKWIEKRRLTPETLEFGKRHANNKIFLLESEIKKLESTLGDEKFVIVEENEGELDEKT